MPEYLVLGLDCGTPAGWALLLCSGTEAKLMGHGQIDLNTKQGENKLRSLLTELAKDARCLGVSVEDAPFGSAHGRTEAEGQRIRRSQAQWLGYIKGWAQAHNVPFLKPTNVSTAKKALTDDGHADKSAMIRFARLRWGEELSEHEADAAAVSLAAFRLHVTKQAMKQQLKLRLNR